MGTTVAELQARMSSAEFSEWMAFYGLEPFGWYADSRGPALITTAIVNRSLQEGEEPANMRDFMASDPPEPQSVDQMKQIAEMYTLALGGQVGEDNG